MLSRSLALVGIPYGHRGARQRLAGAPGRGAASWTLSRRRWAPHGRPEFCLFLGLYNALVARFGFAADERFTAVLNNITKARQRGRRQQYNAGYRARPQDEAQRTVCYNAAYRARPRTEEKLMSERLTQRPTCGATGPALVPRSSRRRSAIGGRRT